MSEREDGQNLLVPAEASNAVDVAVHRKDPPFVGMFPTPGIQGGFVLEFSALFAIVAYAIAGYLLVEIIGLFESGMEGMERKTKKR